jgi:hypothetical protein
VTVAVIVRNFPQLESGANWCHGRDNSSDSVKLSLIGRWSHRGPRDFVAHSRQHRLYLLFQYQLYYFKPSLFEYYWL